MLIDCDRCVMQHTVACGDCVVGVMLRSEGAPIEVDRTEVDALANLAEAGLVPRLRLVPHRRSLHPPPADQVAG